MFFGSIMDCPNFLKKCIFFCGSLGIDYRLLPLYLVDFTGSYEFNDPCSGKDSQIYLSPGFTLSFLLHIRLPIPHMLRKLYVQS